jgi:hypothetical protein
LGTPIHPDDLSQELPKAFAVAKLPTVRSVISAIHVRACCSLFGFTQSWCRKTLGNSNYQVTMDTYAHMIPALRNEVVDRMDEIFSTTVSEAVKSTPTVTN